MNIKAKLRKLIKGLTVPQEYCCLEMESLQHPFSTILTLKDKLFKLDITHTHLFLGYKPLIIGVYVELESEEHKNLADHNQVLLSLVQNHFLGDFHWRHFQADRKSVARLILRKQEERRLKGYALFVYEGEYGDHSFLSQKHQFINSQLQRLHRRQSTNVSLNDNLYDQVRIAYAIPRQISIVTVSDGSRINMFPTDLHGPIGKNAYVGSLRIGGLANDQVELYKRIVISKVEASSYRENYALGKNHMAELQGEEKFSRDAERSHVFDFPLPRAVVSYQELKHIDSLDYGIHRIHLYEVVHRKELRHQVPTLGHIHQYYAQWRLDHGLETQLFFR